MRGALIVIVAWAVVSCSHPPETNTLAEEWAKTAYSWEENTQLCIELLRECEARCGNDSAWTK